MEPLQPHHSMTRRIVPSNEADMSQQASASMRQMFLTLCFTCNDADIFRGMDQYRQQGSANILKRGSDMLCGTRNESSHSHWMKSPLMYPMEIKCPSLGYRSGQNASLTVVYAYEINHDRLQPFISGIRPHADLLLATLDRVHNSQFHPRSSSTGPARPILTAPSTQSDSIAAQKRGQDCILAPYRHIA